jgi:hypothetical protein
MSLHVTARVFEPDGGPDREPQQRVADHETNREEQEPQPHAAVLGGEEPLLCAMHDRRAADKHAVGGVRDVG